MHPQAQANHHPSSAIPVRIRPVFDKIIEYARATIDNIIMTGKNLRRTVTALSDFSPMASSSPSCAPLIRTSVDVCRDHFCVRQFLAGESMLDPSPNPYTVRWWQFPAQSSLWYWSRVLIGLIDLYSKSVSSVFLTYLAGLRSPRQGVTYMASEPRTEQGAEKKEETCHERNGIQSVGIPRVTYMTVIHKSIEKWTPVSRLHAHGSFKFKNDDLCSVGLYTLNFVPNGMDGWKFIYSNGYTGVGLLIAIL